MRLQTARVPGIGLKVAGKPANSRLTPRINSNQPHQHVPKWLKQTFLSMCPHGAQHRRILGIADCYLKTTPHTQGADAESDKQECQQCGIKRSDVHEGLLWGLTFELSGRKRQDARPGLATIYRVPPDRARWPAVYAPLEQRFRP